MLLQDKVAIVTGAGAGIGCGIAIGLAREGAHVVVNYIHSAEGAEEVAAQIRQLGRKAITCAADVSNATQVQAMVTATVEAFGRVDILVNNAGIDPHVPFLEMTEAQWDWIMDTNLKGNFLCSQAVAREMVKTGGGKIVIISSIHSIMTYNHITAYAATKGGLNALTRQLALELAPYHINVNCVAPGAVHVDKFRRVVPNYNPHMFDHEIPVGFIGSPEDIAAAVTFLVSDRAKYITGQVLFVDGGTSARMVLGVSDKKVDLLDQVKTLEQQ
ncbi:MAG: SDR family oxidoreductase [Chloroflexi bacterium]|nr:SDR family oxidoreductase [Chloroflexota bacterium]